MSAAAVLISPPEIERTSETATSKKSQQQQAIEEATASLIAKLEAGHSSALADHLRAMARLRKYSFGNQMLIAIQRPDATHVAGFHKWLELHRYVMKGQKAIRILAPMIAATDRDTDRDTGKPFERGPRVIGFRRVNVFDISQTDGEPLPEVSLDVHGDPGEAIEKLSRFCAARSIVVEIVDDLGGPMGVSTGGVIKLVADESRARLFSTFVHEVAHELLHKDDRRKAATKTVRETEAEATAFIVCQSIGLDPANSSADYIQMYDGSAATLAESLKYVMDAAKEIVAALEGAQSDDEN